MKSTAINPSLPDTCFISYPADGQQRFTRASVVRTTPTLVYVRPVGAPETSEPERFRVTQFADGSLTWYNRNNPYRTRQLRFDTEKVEAEIEARQQRVARTNMARQLRGEIERQATNDFNGFGEYCGGEEGLARLRAALAVLRGEDETH